MAGAYIRLGKPERAADLLEPLRTRFPGDYGIHANLGTAYHLLRRFKEAEVEISRDLEINPDAHFGLEKYHLALLEYLAGDDPNQNTHVYVDEWSEAMLAAEWSEAGLMDWNLTETPEHSRTNIPAQTMPQYRLKWNLATDTNFEAGITYMATMNPREPACFVMLGVACLKKGYMGRHLHLAISAFQKAIDLGSPQAPLLKKRIAIIQRHLAISESNTRAMATVAVIVFSVPVLILIIVSRRQLAKLWRGALSRL